MLKNFFTLMYRHLSKSLLNSFIGFFGMIFGLTAFLFILLWVTNELKFDQFLTNKEQIYRLEFNDKSGDNLVLLPSIVVPIIRDNVPELDMSVRTRFLQSDLFVKSLENEMQSFINSGRYSYASNDFFKIFSFKFIVGNPENSLSKRGDVVITESLAKSIFGKTNVVGQTLATLGETRYNITGVIKDEPNFHIPFKMIISYATLGDSSKAPGNDIHNSWYFSYMPAYLTFKNKGNIKEVEEKIASVLNEHCPKKIIEENGKFNCYLRPLNDIYFKGGEAKEEGYATHGNLKKVIAYISIVLLILILVCINYININTSNYLNRIKEVGIKKLSGATKKSLFFQFFGETLIKVLLSFLIALLLVYQFLPRFNYLMFSNLEAHYLFTPYNLISIFIGLSVISLVSGGIPALFITSFNPAQILKGILNKRGKKSNFTRVSLVIQFAMTTILLIITLTVYLQIDYMRKSDLGLEIEHKIYFPFNGTYRNTPQLQQLKTSLLANPKILSVSSSFYGTPALSSSADRTKDKVEYNGNEYKLDWVWADEDYMEALDLKLIDGKFFGKKRGHTFIHKSGKISTEYSKDESDPIEQIIGEIVLNEAAIKVMGIKTPLESYIKVEGRSKYKIIGVLKDFHLSSLDRPITPMYFVQRGGYDAIAKLAPQNIPETIEFIKQKFKEVTGEELIDIQFLDEEFGKLYRKDESFSKLLSYATLFAILIACLGLLGMVSQTIILRIKEVGVRKSLGSSSTEILILFIKPIMLLVVISTLISVPVAWYFATDWLSNYPYNVGINWSIFVFAFVFMLLTTFLTVVWKCLRISSRNPVELLRDE